MAGALAERRKLQVGVYATGHSACGTPTPQYVFDLLKTALEDEHVGGTTVYTTKYPTHDCATSRTRTWAAR